MANEFLVRHPQLPPDTRTSGNATDKANAGTALRETSRRSGRAPLRPWRGASSLLLSGRQRASARARHRRIPASLFGSPPGRWEVAGGGVASWSCGPAGRRAPTSSSWPSCCRSPSSSAPSSPPPASPTTSTSASCGRRSRSRQIIQEDACVNSEQNINAYICTNAQMEINKAIMEENEASDEEEDDDREYDEEDDEAGEDDEQAPVEEKEPVVVGAAAAATRTRNRPRRQV
uniref:Uncharacterized protein n=1 Tax=Setaria italica TaxID=4555 RepID=K3XLK6_SETIT